MATYAWKFIDNSGSAVPEQNWNTPSSWVLYPVVNPPVTGVVPGAWDSAYFGVGAGNANVSAFGFARSYPVTVDLTDSLTLATLGLGGMAITGVNLGSPITPVFSAPTIFPTIKVNGDTTSGSCQAARGIFHSWGEA